MTLKIVTRWGKKHEMVREVEATFYPHCTAPLFSRREAKQETSALRVVLEEKIMGGRGGIL